MPSTISAAVKPLLTSATSTESTPAIRAPMIGMNPPKKVSTASGRASGTPTISEPEPDEEPVDQADQHLARMKPPRVSQTWHEHHASGGRRRAARRCGAPRAGTGRRP